MDWSLVFMLMGFTFAAYSIVANDTIQTLGTFLCSNSKRPWYVLWAFAATILSSVLIYGWYANGGDVSYGRLSQIPFPAVFEWWHVLPPLALIFMTRQGIPVSTTFLVLSVFTPGLLLGKIVLKSIVGYGVAFLAALVIWYVFSKLLEKRFIKQKVIKKKWVAAQWASTAFLWSMWLIQDLANIFVFLPRQLELTELLLALTVLLGFLAFIFRSSGGKIQKIVTSKTNTTDIRSATLIDFTYGLVLFYFKNLNDLPMSTTWVFLGLLAGREFAINHRLEMGNFAGVRLMSFKDFGKAMAGLGVSLILALGIKSVMIGENLFSKNSQPSVESQQTVEVIAADLSQATPSKKAL